MTWRVDQHLLRAISVEIRPHQLDEAVVKTFVGDIDEIGRAARDDSTTGVDEIGHALPFHDRLRTLLNGARFEERSGDEVETVDADAVFAKQTVFWNPCHLQYSENGRERLNDA